MKVSFYLYEDLQQFQRENIGVVRRQGNSSSVIRDDYGDLGIDPTSPGYPSTHGSAEDQILGRPQ